MMFLIISTYTNSTTEDKIVINEDKVFSVISELY